MKRKEKIAASIPEEKHSGMKKTWNILRIIKNIICWTMIVVLAFLVITFLLNRVSGVTPSLFGYTIQRVSSGSMEPELKVGDVILSKNVEDVMTLEIGDIITFKGGEQFGNQNVTHRVVVAPHREGNTIYLQTKGDANEIADGQIEGGQVNSRMTRKIPFLTKLYDFFLSPWGLIIFIGLLLLVFFDELLNVVRIATKKYPEEKTESINEIMERIQREDAEKAHKERVERSQKMIEIMIDEQEQHHDEGE